MPLLPPIVLGPLSECNRTVQVEGQLLGTLVRVYADGRLVAEGTATWSPQTFRLLPGERLNAAEGIVATQEQLGSPPSAESPRPIVVQAAPPSAGLVAFTYENTQCGECVWIAGAIPGATVKVRELTTDMERGSGEAPHGTARFSLAPANQAGEILSATQRACALSPVETHAPPTRAISPNQHLPRPRIVTPLRACTHAVTVENAVVGATITLQRESGATFSCFDAPRLFFFVDPPLAAGEELIALQEFPSCPDIERVMSEPVIVEEVAPIAAPWIEGPICVGSRSIHVRNLEPGALLKVLKNGAELGTWQVPINTNRCLVPLVPTAEEGDRISVQQELCDIWSALSNVIVVSTLARALGALYIRGPLYACGGVVRVAGVRSGTWVTVWSTALRAPIGEVFVPGVNEVDVLVAPLLIAGDELYCTEMGCSDEVRTSGIVGVTEAAQELPAPTVLEPIFDDPNHQGGLVWVENVLPGAFVDIFVNGIWRSGQFVGSVTEPPRATRGSVMTGNLIVGDIVTARQRLCDLISPESTRPITVFPIPPQAHFTATPIRGNVPLAVRFASDTRGVVTELGWDFTNDGTFDRINESDVTNTYNLRGEYTAVLRATGPAGIATTWTQAITVLPPRPRASFEAIPTSGPAPLGVTCVDSSVGEITSYLWTFPGADRSSSSDRNPAVVYSSAGRYEIRLNVTGPGGSASSVQYVTVSAPPRPARRNIRLTAWPYVPSPGQPVLRVDAASFAITYPGGTSRTVTGALGFTGAEANLEVPVPSPGTVDTYSVTATVYYSSSRAEDTRWTSAPWPVMNDRPATVSVGTADSGVAFVLVYDERSGVRLEARV